MKKLVDYLQKLQDEAELRRKLLQTGQIRLERQDESTEEEKQRKLDFETTQTQTPKPAH